MEFKKGMRVTDQGKCLKLFPFLFHSKNKIKNKTISFLAFIFNLFCPPHYLKFLHKNRKVKSADYFMLPGSAVDLSGLLCNF
jgi:hypothetical protein